MGKEEVENLLLYQFDVISETSVINWLTKFKADMNYVKDIPCDKVVTRNVMNFIIISKTFISKIRSY